MIPVIELDDNHKPTRPWESERWGVCGCHNVRGYDGPPTVLCQYGAGNGVNQSTQEEES